LRPKGMMLTGGALATALAVAAGPAIGATTPRDVRAQAAAAADAPDGAKAPGAQEPDDAKKPGAKKPDDAKKPGAKTPDAAKPAPGGTVFGGVTPQSWPVVVALSKTGNRVDRVAIGLDVTCTSGDSFGTSDAFRALKLSKTGRFSTTFGPQRIDAGGVPADVESRVIGRIAPDGSSVRGIWSLKITIYDPSGATVVDTCESGLVRWRARQ
jgi:hypothetical protein